MKVSHNQIINSPTMMKIDTTRDDASEARKADLKFRKAFLEYLAYPTIAASGERNQSIQFRADSPPASSTPDDDNVGDELSIESHKSFVKECFKKIEADVWVDWLENARAFDWESFFQIA